MYWEEKIPTSSKNLENIFSSFRFLKKLINFPRIRGFKAVQKHQNKILLLVKMMYSSCGDLLSCFKGGENCINELENRFNPKVNDDGELNIFVQK